MHFTGRDGLNQQHEDVLIGKFDKLDDAEAFVKAQPPMEQQQCDVHGTTNTEHFAAGYKFWNASFPRCYVIRAVWVVAPRECGGTSTSENGLGTIV